MYIRYENLKKKNSLELPMKTWGKTILYYSAYPFLNWFTKKYIIFIRRVAILMSWRPFY